MEWHDRSGQLFVVYGLTPLLIAFLIFTVGPERTSQWPPIFGVLYWLLAVYIGWLIKDFCTLLVAWLDRRNSVSLFFTLLIGGVTSTPIVFVGMSGLITVFHENFIPMTAQSPLPQFGIDHLLGSALGSLIFWIALNIAFVRIFGIGRFGFEPPSRVWHVSERDHRSSHLEINPDKVLAAAIALPPLFHQLDRDIGELSALSAEQHYVRVIGTRDESLIRYRMEDAVADAEAVIPGMRIHRSWWVAKSQVIAVEDRGRERALHLTTGQHVPVSRAYRAMVEKALGAAG